MNGGGSNLREKFLWLQARRKNNKFGGEGVSSHKNSFNRLYFSQNKILIIKKPCFAFLQMMLDLVYVAYLGYFFVQDLISPELLCGPRTYCFITKLFLFR